MMRAFAPIAALLCALALMTACQSEAETPIDRTPLPATAAPPYICGHIPLKAVELMTGVRDPLVRGRFDLTSIGGLGDGSCAIYQRNGEQLKVLLIDLTPVGSLEKIKEAIGYGASPLPEIVPGAVGHYSKDPLSEHNAAVAVLVRGKAQLSVQLEIGVEGRDNAADVAAMMKLIAPKLITDASAPAASPSVSPSVEAASPSSTKD
ncbi:hypothetical protein Ppa06_14960 [Planomonospora parontospora subsp. parontospora]|uniref:DUF3558 domain-containing protein n=3 Tax=Planomonospora parontospora TaxID=58119 RepID=A0AA37F3C6_9ACTN|nr:hypothetical protein GCM10010126_15510 [Planomonospora parontospora]GII07698.1 hypothetical protein Ppa06_14960 [Planomonospora parontospora subsp. parontospora]